MLSLEEDLFFLFLISPGPSSGRVFLMEEVPLFYQRNPTFLVVPVMDGSGRTVYSFEVYHFVEVGGC